MAAQVLPHTAIPTWSGFIYQGRIGLYHVLKELNSKQEYEINKLVSSFRSGVLNGSNPFNVIAKFLEVFTSAPISLRASHHLSYAVEFLNTNNKPSAAPI